MWLFGPKLSLQKCPYNPNFHMAAGLPTKAKRIVCQQLWSDWEPVAKPIFKDGSFIYSSADDGSPVIAMLF